jgi:hypothetical protein
LKTRWYREKLSGRGQIVVQVDLSTWKVGKIKKKLVEGLVDVEGWRRNQIALCAAKGGATQIARGPNPAVSPG